MDDGFVNITAPLTGTSATFSGAVNGLTLISLENNSAKIKVASYLSLQDNAYNVGIGYTQDNVPVGGTKLAVNGKGYFADALTGTSATFSGTVTGTGANNTYAGLFQGVATAGQSYGLKIEAGTNSSDFAFAVVKHDQSATFFNIKGDASATFSGALTGTSATFSGAVKLAGYTVATLPAGTVGMTAYVTDALAPTFGATLVGGGAVITKAFYNGTNWINQ